MARLGYPFAIASAAVSGSISVLGKLAVAGGMDPLPLTALVALGTAAILFPASPRMGIRRGDLPLVLAVAGLGGSGGPLLFYLGLQALNAGGSPNAASVAALLVNAEVLFTILIALALFGERADRWEALAMALLGAGAIAVTTNLQVSPAALAATASANLPLLASYLLWGIDNNLSRVLSERNNLFQLLWVKYLVGGAALLAVALTLGRPLPGPPAPLAFVALLAAAYAAGTSTFYAALARIGAMRSISLFSTAAAFGVLLALPLGERVSAAQGAGGLLMGLGVLLLARKEAVGAPGGRAAPGAGGR